MVRSTGVRNPLKLLLTKQTFDVFILISVKWNLSSHILYFIYMQRLGIQFVEMHCNCTRTHISFFYILISIRVTIAFYLYVNFKIGTDDLSLTVSICGYSPLSLYNEVKRECQKRRRFFCLQCSPIVASRHFPSKMLF